MGNIVENLYKLRAVEAELLRRKEEDWLAKYNTGEKIHQKQMAFHQCNKRNRWVFGGNRSGKTECGAVECVYMARGTHPYRENRKDTQGWVVSLSQQVQRDVAQKKILRYLRKDWIDEVVMLSGRKDAPESGVIDFIRVKNVFVRGIHLHGDLPTGRKRYFQATQVDFGKVGGKCLEVLEFEGEGVVKVVVGNGKTEKTFLCNLENGGANVRLNMPGERYSIGLELEDKTKIFAITAQIQQLRAGA